MIRSVSICFACLALLFTSHTQDTEKYSDREEPVVIEMSVLETAAPGFHRSLIKAGKIAVREGRLRRGELVRLRFAMMSPAFRKNAEDLAVGQMYWSGVGEIPMTPDGAVDRAQIDWDAIIAFLEKLIPLLLKLITAIG
jgi:hypothetical protein